MMKEAVGTTCGRPQPRATIGRRPCGRPPRSAIVIRVEHHGHAHAARAGRQLGLADLGRPHSSPGMLASELSSHARFLDQQSGPTLIPKDQRARSWAALPGPLIAEQQQRLKL